MSTMGRPRRPRKCHCPHEIPTAHAVGIWQSAAPSPLAYASGWLRGTNGSTAYGSVSNDSRIKRDGRPGIRWMASDFSGQRALRRVDISRSPSLACRRGGSPNSQSTTGVSRRLARCVSWSRRSLGRFIFPGFPLALSCSGAMRVWRRDLERLGQVANDTAAFSICDRIFQLGTFPQSKRDLEPAGSSIFSLHTAACICRQVTLVASACRDYIKSLRLRLLATNPKSKNDIG